MVSTNQLDLWGDKLQSKLENGTHQQRQYLKFLDGLVWRANNNMDAVVAVCGERGMGKSSFAITSGILLRRKGINFDFENIFYGPDALKGAVTNISQSRKGAYVFDEMIDLAYSRNAMTTLNRSLAQFFTKIRKMNNIVFLCIPRFKALDPALRNDIVHFWAEVFWKSYAQEHKKRFALVSLFRKDKNQMTDDPWGFDNKYIYKRAFKPLDQLRIMKKMRSYVGCVNCPPLPKPIEKAYEDTARDYLKTSSEDLITAFEKKKAKSKSKVVYHDNV